MANRFETVRLLLLKLKPLVVWINVRTGGLPGEAICARCYREDRKVMVKLLDAFFYHIDGGLPDHCLISRCNWLLKFRDEEE